MQEGTTSSVTFPSSSAKDVLTELLREGACQMLATAIEAEVADWIESHAHLKDENGYQLLGLKLNETEIAWESQIQ